jgi:hypothetical protein
MTTILVNIQEMKKLEGPTPFNTRYDTIRKRYLPHSLYVNRDGVYLSVGINL